MLAMSHASLSPVSPRSSSAASVSPSEDHCCIPVCVGIFPLPGRSSGCPLLPPQTRTCPIEASGSSVIKMLSHFDQLNKHPRLAHNFCCPFALAKCCG